MEGSDGSPPLSMWIVRAAETFPKPIIEKEDKKLMVPFAECKLNQKKNVVKKLKILFSFSNWRIC